MSEQADALAFGPQWIRDLSNGTTVCAPPPSPGPKYKLAEFRYGKEEMLALYSPDLTHPDMAEVAEYILTKQICEPLACIPMSEEEQRTSFGSLNSAAVLKMMGRGGQRGGRGVSRGGRGSGRGRGEGGIYRGFSVDESSNKGDDTWQRDTANRRLSWGENGRSTYSERSPSSREPEPPSPRTLELSAPPVRHKEPSRALSSGNWRSSDSAEGDDTGTGGGAWTVSGSQRTDKWRGSGRGGWHSQGSREEYQGGGGYNDSWGRDRPKRSNSDDLPEWSKSDNVFEPDLGSFDSSGAFCVSKDKKELHDTGQKQQVNEKESKEDWENELNDDKNNSFGRKNDKVDQHREEKVTSKDADIGKDRKREDSQGKATDIQQQANVRQNKMAAKPTEKNTKTTPVGEEKASELKLKSATDNEGSNKTTTNSHDEIGAHLERVAESCIANLDVEGEDDHKSLNTAPSSGGSPIEENTKWFYQDPQGNEQGPFRSAEMVEWFHHGYFTMQLSIRRQCDAMYLPLGEVIKRWQRVPFLPGAAPAPITHQQLMSEQTMMMQQQLLQQHYQQLQKQAILQQIQQQQHRAPNLPTSPDNDPSLVHSPHSLPVTTVGHGGAAEAIWGTEPESPKGPWSPVSTNTSVWDQQNRQKSPVPSAKEAKRLAEGKAKVETEAEFVTLKRQEEEKRQEMMKKEEEERLQSEASQRENELRIKKQKEEEEVEMRREKERRRQEIQKQVEADKRQVEAARQKKEAQQEQKQKKESGEQKQKQNEMREQQKQALLRLQQQQEQRAEQQRQEQIIHERQEQEKQQIMEQKREEEINLLLQQKKMQSSRCNWGSQNAAALSLSEIQEQEEKNRRANDEKMRDLEARQRQLQTVAHGWAEKQSSSSSIKSLKSIQDEQARQQRTKQSKQAQQQHTQPAAPSSGAWANSNSGSSGGGSGSWGAGNNNIWSGITNHTDDDDDDNNGDTGFWAEAGRTASSKAPKANVSQPSSTQPVANGKKPGKKATKEEESVRRIFQPTVSNDPFTEWCIEHLNGLTTSVDIPTFVTFLKEVDSPYEIHDYVRDFFGDSDQAKSFAKEFIERKKRAAEKRNTAVPKAAPTRPIPASGVVARGGGNRMPTPNTSDNNTTANGKAKKKKKQRMQKVDPRILGFSVNASTERTNMGEIQSLDDAS